MNTYRISGLVVAGALFAISMRIAVAQSREQVALPPGEIRAKAAAKDTAIGSPEKPGQADTVMAGAIFGLTYFYLDFSDQNKNKGGDMVLGDIGLTLDSRRGDLSLFTQYSFRGVFYQGWLGYRASDAWQCQLGVMRTPFGLLPFGSHGFLYSLPFYIGFEDDNDLGLKSIWDLGGWNLQMAFFKNDELGIASNPMRASFDVVSDTQANAETNKLNGRLARVFKHGGSKSSEIGVSGQWGGIYNSMTEDFGDMWAAAAHYNGVYGPLNLQLEAISYRYHPENPAGVDGRTIEFGGYGVSTLVASAAEIYLVNLAYSVPVPWGPIRKLTFYNDYAILAKRADFPNSHFNASGCFVTADPLYAYVDYSLGKNALFLGEGTHPYGAAMDSDEEWHARSSINVGYAFKI